MNLWQILANWPIPSKWLDRKFVNDAQSAGKPMRHRQHREKEKIQCHLSVRESEFSLISPNHTDAWPKQRSLHQFRVWHRVLGMFIMRGPGTSPTSPIPKGFLCCFSHCPTAGLVPNGGASKASEATDSETMIGCTNGAASLGKSTVETDWPLQPKLVGRSTLDFPNSSLECSGGSPILVLRSPSYQIEAENQIQTFLTYALYAPYTYQSSTAEKNRSSRSVILQCGEGPSNFKHCAGNVKVEDSREIYAK